MSTSNHATLTAHSLRTAYWQLWDDGRTRLLILYNLHLHGSIPFRENRHGDVLESSLRLHEYLKHPRWSREDYFSSRSTTGMITQISYLSRSLGLTARASRGKDGGCRAIEKWEPTRGIWRFHIRRDKHCTADDDHGSEQILGCARTAPGLTQNRGLASCRRETIRLWLAG